MGQTWGLTANGQKGVVQNKVNSMLNYVKSKC